MLKIRSTNERDIEDLKLMYMLSNDLICIVDYDGRYKRINPAFESLLGYKVSELIGRSAFSLIHEKDLQRTEDVMNLLCRGEHIKNFENCLKHKNGSLVHISWSAVACGSGVYAIGRDITAMVKAEAILEEQQRKILTESAKIYSLGEMALGIGHEIKNPLSIINLIINRIRKVANEGQITPEFISTYMEKTECAVKRIDKIVQGLKTLSRNNENDPQENFRLKEVITEMADLMDERLKKDEVTLEIVGLDHVEVYARSSMIAQVMVNLITNSCDAIKHLETKWIRIDCFENDGQYFIQFTDSGYGIKKEDQDKIFQKFYTTKRIGEGTGLGLSISKKIIEHNGGVLYLDSHCAHTRFVFSLDKAKVSARVA